MKAAGGGAATSGTTALAIWLAILACMTSCTEAQGGCVSTFFGAMIQLMPCQAAVAPFSPQPPNEACCRAVRMLGQPCLCAVINGPPAFGIDRVMTMQLPGKCAVQFEPCR